MAYQWDALTRALLFDLFRHQSKGRNEFHHNFHEDLGHGSRRGHPGINIEPVDEVFNRFEQVDDRIVTGADVLDGLTHVHVSRMDTWEITKGRTERRMAKPANMAFAGGNGCRVKASETCNTNRHPPTYHSDSLADGTSRE